MNFVINPVGAGSIKVVTQNDTYLIDDNESVLIDDNSNVIYTQIKELTLHINEHLGYSLISVLVDGEIALTSPDGNVYAAQTATIVANFAPTPYKSVKAISAYTVWRGYVKDALNLEDPPKAFLTILSHDIRQDLLTTANSQFECLAVPDNVSNGDILIVSNPYGVTRYLGIIKSIEGTSIQTYQMQHFYSGKWVYDSASGESTIENAVVSILTDFANGEMLNSTYTDPLVAQLKSDVSISAGSSTSGKLETKEANTVEEMETFIYDLYKNYNILLDFNIAYSGTNSVTVLKPSYSTVKIGNNTNAITNITPLTQIEETNRLIIYAKNGTYRDTYVAKSDGTIVSEPAAITNRFGVVNTKIVFTDDTATDVIKANLPSQVYNHKLTFTLRLENKLYGFDDLKLGTPLSIWVDDQYYSSIVTGLHYKKESNQPVTEVEYTCGMVRTSLSDKLSLRLGVL